MRGATLLALVCLVFTISGSSAREGASEALSRIFIIDQIEADRCIAKLGATTDDFRLLEEVINDTPDIKIDSESLRRATCTAVCCAQVKGLMKGAKIQLTTIHDMISDSVVPQVYKEVFHRFVDECNEQVKDMTDPCEAGITYLKCTMEKYAAAEFR